MQLWRTVINYMILFYCSIYSVAYSANSSQEIEDHADSSINRLYHTLHRIPKRTMTERIDWFSKHFKDTVYILGALGEGPKARYDQFPRYRVDAFDCDTYVNTVLALALANSLHSFHQCLRFNRYKDGKITYIQRNHFTSIDWNFNNQQRGVLKDITTTILDEQKKPVAQYSTTLIDKAGWYAHKTTEAIRLSDSNSLKKSQRLSELQAQGSQLKPAMAKVPYLPFSALFTNQQPNHYLFSQIPHGAIIEIVRPNWDLSQQIGTHLDISHLGFAIRQNGILYFRQASSQYGKVVDVPLIDYLYEALSSPTIKGINVQIVLPQQPVENSCSQFHSLYPRSTTLN